MFTLVIPRDTMKSLDKVKVKKCISLKGCLNLVSNLYFETEDDFFSTDKVLATQQ